MAALNIVSGLLFSQAASAAAIVGLGVLLTLAGNIISFTYHTYQQERYPTAIRALSGSCIRGALFQLSSARS